MTGTAATEAEEFGEIYGLGVIEIPTNVDIARIDEHDEFYRTADEKYEALVSEIADAQEKGQPVLVGTVSIEKSELLSAFLKKKKIKHQVLNARYHEQEAQIVAQAGRYGSVTIATNMAGRGTDIQLGGNADMRIAQETADVDEEARLQKITDRIHGEVAAEKQKVIEAGGLYVIGTERHESRRIDNQLRGRSGRQGDPGRSKFFLSLQDDLMRIFGPERMDSMLVRLGIEEGEAIIHPWINKAIEKAQQKVEARNYDVRKNLVKFDDVMNDQRRVIYEQRRDIMDSDDVSETIKDMRSDVVHHRVETRIPPKSFAEQWDLTGLKEDADRLLGLDAPVEEWGAEEGVDDTIITERLEDVADKHMAAKAAKYGPDFWRHVEKSMLLQMVDQEWKDHLQNLDHLRQGVGLRAYGQRDPLNEYKTEGFSLFESMLYQTREEVTQLLARLEIAPQIDPAMLAPQAPSSLEEQHIDPMTGENEMAPGPIVAGPPPGSVGEQTRIARAGANTIDPNDPSTWGRVSRNAPCPCGSGRKYKHCHGAFG